MQSVGKAIQAGALFGGREQSRSGEEHLRFRVSSIVRLRRAKNERGR
jgi:hypothetical protein